jgi:hypothetical protein
MRRSLTLSCALVLFVQVVLFLPSPPSANANPITVTGTFQYRDNGGPNTVGNSVGESVKLGAVGVTPDGTQGTTVTATQGSTTLPPLHFSPSKFVPGLGTVPNEFRRGSTTASLTGPSWLLTFTNGSDTPTEFTPDLSGAPFVPLVENLAMSGNALTPTFTWTIPNGFTPDAVLVGISDLSNPDPTSAPVYGTILTGNLTSFTVPAVFPGGGRLIRGHAYNFDVNMVVTRGHVALTTYYEPSFLSRSQTYLDFSIPLLPGNVLYDDFNTGTTIDPSKWTSSLTPNLFSQHDGRLYFSSSVDGSGQRLVSNPIAGDFMVRTDFYNFSSDTTYPPGYQGRTSAAVLGMGPSDNQVIVLRAHTPAGEQFLSLRNVAGGGTLEFGQSVATTATQGMLRLVYSNGVVTALYNVGLDPLTGWTYLGTLHPNWDPSYVPSFFLLGGSNGTGTTSFQFDNVVYSPVAALYATFPGHGVWEWNGTTWTQLNAQDPANMAASGSSLYATFTGAGVWEWNGITWTQLNAQDPANMAASAN